MKQQFIVPINNHSSSTLVLYIEPEGMVFYIEPGLVGTIHFDTDDDLTDFEIVYDNENTLAVYSCWSYRMVIDGEEVHPS